MLEIVRVDALDGNTIDVELNNGNILLLNMDLLRNNPAFAKLFEDNLIIHPQTDGTRLIWANGAKIGLNELLDLVTQNHSACHSR